MRFLVFLIFLLVSTVSIRFGDANGSFKIAENQEKRPRLDFFVPRDSLDGAQTLHRKYAKRFEGISVPYCQYQNAPICRCLNSGKLILNF